MKEQISEEIRRFIRENSGNCFPESDRPYFEEALVGCAAADDPLFAEYKRIIGLFHQTPQEILSSSGKEGIARSVICWVLPLTRATRESNRDEDTWPSREWSLTRTHGENLNVALRRHLVDHLERLGHQAVAPQLAQDWQQLDDPFVGIASTWSERHALYAAGLGTFSLNDGLITAAGVAHRCGSVVTTLQLPPTGYNRPSHLHNCLYHREGTCGLCISRCPVGAISREGHDKSACRRYVYEAVPAAVGGRYGVAQTGCGLCQTKVPCEAQIPQGMRK